MKSARLRVIRGSFPFSDPLPDALAIVDGLRRIHSLPRNLPPACRDSRETNMTLKLMKTLKTLLTFAGLSLTALSQANAAGPRVFDPPLPNDIRLKPLKDYDGYFPFTPPKSKAEWDKRAEYVRR